MAKAKINSSRSERQWHHQNCPPCDFQVRQRTQRERNRETGPTTLKTAGVKTVTIPQTFANNPFARRTDFQIAGRVGRKIDRMMVSIAYRY
jgi:hypothetical protein